MTIGASCPWNLSTVPIRAPGMRDWSSKTCALYGAMIRMSSSVIADSRPVSIDPVGARRKNSSTRSLMASASSGEQLWLPSCATARKRRPVPVTAAR